jgi:hypothetical protein
LCVVKTMDRGADTVAVVQPEHEETAAEEEETVSVWREKKRKVGRSRRSSITQKKKKKADGEMPGCRENEGGTLPDEIRLQNGASSPLAEEVRHEQEGEEEGEENAEEEEDGGESEETEEGEPAASDGSMPAKRRDSLRCEYCQKDFNVPSTLRVHLRTHTGKQWDAKGEKKVEMDTEEKRKKIVGSSGTARALFLAPPPLLPLLPFTRHAMLHRSLPETKREGRRGKNRIGWDCSAYSLSTCQKLRNMCKMAAAVALSFLFLRSLLRHRHARGKRKGIVWESSEEEREKAEPFYKTGLASCLGLARRIFVAFRPACTVSSSPFFWLLQCVCVCVSVL